MRMSFTSHPEVDQVLSTLLENVQGILGHYFVGMYLYGSLATGDFNPKSSDIDFCVITQDILPDEFITHLEMMHKKIWASPSKWAAKLEGAYLPKSLIRRRNPNGPACPVVNEGKFYLGTQGSDWVIQRHVLREKGVVLAGPDPITLIDYVSPQEIRNAVRGVLEEWWFPMLTDSAWLVNHGSEYHAYAVISMCRALHALEHGTIVSKPIAAEWASIQYADHARLIKKSLDAQDGTSAGFAEDALGFIDMVKKLV